MSPCGLFKEVRGLLLLGFVWPFYKLTGYYPQLIALYNRLGVSFRVSDFSYSFSLLTPPSGTKPRQINARALYNGASGRAGVSMPSYMEEAYRATKGRGFIVRAVTKAWTIWVFALMTVQMVVCYLRLLCFAVPVCRTRGSELIMFGEWAEQTVPRCVLARWLGADVVWREFVYMVLLPLFSAVCTAPAEDVLRHPVEEFLGEFFIREDLERFDRFGK